MTKLKPCQALKDLIDMNMVKLQVTEWVKRTGDKEGGISDSVDRGTGKTNRTLPSRDRSLPPRDGNLPLSAISCHFLPAT